MSVSGTKRCWVEVDLRALRTNLAWLRHRVGPDRRIITVVKADAYGHGLRQTAALLMQSGTDVFGVATPTEARVVRQVGSGWPVLLLGAALPDEIAGLVRDGVMATLSTWDEARQFSRVAAAMGRRARVHLKVDTGMGRLGVPAAGALALLRRLRRLPALEVCGLYTHFSSAEDDVEFTGQQARLFRNTLGSALAAGWHFEYVPAANTAGLLHESGAFFNTVRPGLLVYGVVPPGRRRGGSEMRRQLQPALSWHARVSLVKDVPRGTPLSYGRSYVAARQMRVAVITVGYGDGYMRSASNRSSVLIGGRRCPTVGRVTMDQILVDVTRAGKVQAGDEAVLIGRQDGGTIGAGELAAWSDTVPWEVLTSISYRVTRIYRGGHAS